MPKADHAPPPPGASAPDVAQTLARADRSAILLSVYKPHPSQQLTELFRAKPYQGAPPQDAEFVFVGLDANYDAHIESSPVFPCVLEYHYDGVAFWRRHGVHHPFLLTDYRGDGQLYHRNFARIGFEPEDACRVSFVELLHIPTVGVSQLVAEDLDSAHLDWLNSLIKLGARRKVFLSDKVVRLMRASKPRERFDWLPEPIAKKELPQLHTKREPTFYQHLHFSNWGQFRERMTLEAAAIARLRTDSPHLTSCSCNHGH